MNEASESGERWRRIVSAEARGEPVSFDETAHRAAFERARPDVVAVEGELWQAVGGLGDAPRSGERSDEDLLAGALARFNAGDDPLGADERDRTVWRVVVIATAAAVAAAAAVVLLLLGPELIGARGSDDQRHDMAPAVENGDDEVHEATPREPETPKRRTAASKAAEPPPAAEPAAVEPEPEPPPTPPKRAVSRPKPPSQTAPASADAQLRRAQALLKRRDRSAALAAYRDLQRRFPRSREAKTALVTMGRLELDRGRPKAALAHFDDYLSKSAGALVKEARYHRIRALARLGRSKQELASIEAFLGDHPKSIYARELRKRADVLRGK